MHRVAPAILASLLLIQSSLAQEAAPAPAPAQAAPAQAQPERAPTRILVLPFNLTGGEGRHAWIGQAIAENFQAELAKSGFAIAPAAVNRPVAVTEVNEAIRIARDSNAEVVIFGSYHFVDPDLRVTGQILDVPSGMPVGAIKVNGTFRQLFQLEDQLVEQAKALMMGDADQALAMGPDARPAPGPAAAPFDVNTTAEDDKTEYKLPYREEPVVVADDDYLGLDYTTSYYPTYYRPRIYTSYYSSYYDWYPASYWYYPSYSYYYSPWYHCYRPRPWFGSGLFFSFNFGHHHRHHWHGHHHHWRDHHWRDRGFDRHDRFTGSGWNASGRRWETDRSRFNDSARERSGPVHPRRESILVERRRDTRDREAVALARPQYVARSINQRSTAGRVIRVDRNAPMQPRDSATRDRETVTIRHPDRTVEVRTQRRPDSDTSSWDPSSRTFSSGNTRDNARTRDDSAARDNTRSRDTDRSAARDNDRPTASRDPVRREADRTPTRETPRESQPRELPRDNARFAPRESPRESAPRESAPAREAPRSIDRGSPRESAPAREAPRSIERRSSSSSRDTGSIRSSGSSSYRDSGSSRSSGSSPSYRDSGVSRSGGSFRSESSGGGSSRSSSGGGSRSSSSSGGGGGRSSGRGR